MAPVKESCDPQKALNSRARVENGSSGSFALTSKDDLQKPQIQRAIKMREKMSKMNLTKKPNSSASWKPEQARNHMGCAVICAMMRTCYVSRAACRNLDKTQVIHALLPHKEGRGQRF